MSDGQNDHRSESGYKQKEFKDNIQGLEDHINKFIGVKYTKHYIDSLKDTIRMILDDYQANFRKYLAKEIFDKITNLRKHRIILDGDCCETGFIDVNDILVLKKKYVGD